jgi:hypothetical protein
MEFARRLQLVHELREVRPSTTGTGPESRQSEEAKRRIMLVSYQEPLKPLVTRAARVGMYHDSRVWGNKA